MTTLSRKDIDVSRKWDPSAIFESASRWDEEFAALETHLDDIDAPDYSGIDTPQDLAAALEEYDEAFRRSGRLWVYAKLCADQDKTDGEAQTRLEKVYTLFQQFDTYSNALERRIRTFDKARLLDSSELNRYHHYIRDVFRRESYRCGDEVQRTIDHLQSVLDAPDSTFQTFIDGDYEAPTVDRTGGNAVSVTPNNRDRLLRHRDREFRRAVDQAYQNAFGVAHNLLADSFATRVDRNVRLAELRGYDSARHAALDQDPVHETGQAFPVDAHIEMIATVRDGLDSYHRYYEAKREHLGIQTLRPWDRYVSLVDGDGPEIPYDQATDLVVDAMEPLGDDYQSRLRSFLDKRRIDVYETQEKSSEALGGALGVKDTDPYILLNYEDDLRSVFILAHELGHAMHYLYANANQPRIYNGFPLAISELPSNLHEVLLADYLADSDDSVMRNHAIDTALRRFEDMFFRHTLLATFTQEAHDHAAGANPLTSEWLDETYGELLEEFQAPLAADKSVSRTWISDNHSHLLYRSYPYVMGRAGARSVVDRIGAGELDPEVYRAFLQAGSSAYPMDLFDTIDLDMTSAESYELAISAFDDHLSLIS